LWCFCDFYRVLINKVLTVIYSVSILLERFLEKYDKNKKKIIGKWAKNIS
jgi:hypothetical protein